MPEEEYICDTDHLILWFENADEAVAFAKDIEVKNCAWELIYEDNEGDEAWVYVRAICDICGRKSSFFAPAEIYEEGIMAIECSGCGNMKSVGKRNGEISENSKARSNMNCSIKGIAHIDYIDSGGASRFFYCAKASRSEKEAGLIEFAECVKCGRFNSKTHTIVVDGEKRKEKCTRNNHPTVKPLDLMKYLINLIKMPSTEENRQVILDPFCGSGTTLAACEQLGINYIGIDQDSDSCLVSMGRIGV